MKKSGRRLACLAAGALLAGYLLVVVFTFARQRRLVFPAPKGVRRPPEVMEIASPDGPVYAIYAPAPEGARTVVHFHGNGDQLGDSADLVSAYRRAGLGAMAVEYPGYGLAASRPPSEHALYRAAEGAIHYLRSAHGVPVEKTVLEGRSLGSGVATEMAARGEGARMILVSPFTSVADVAAGRFPFLPVRLLVLDRFDNAAKAPRITLPVLVVHGSADRTIPVEMGRRLASLFPRAKLDIVDGADHATILSRPEVLARMAAFASE